MPVQHDLLTQDEQVECFRNAARHLESGGRFVIELGVPPLRFLPPDQVAVPFDVSERHVGFDTFDLVEQVLLSHHFTRDGEGGRYRRENSRHRYAWPAEISATDSPVRAGLRLRAAGTRGGTAGPRPGGAAWAATGAVLVVLTSMSPFPGMR